MIILFHFCKPQKYDHTLIENDIKKDIVIIAEGHLMLAEKLDRLSHLNEQVLELKTDNAALKFATSQMLKVVK